MAADIVSLNIAELIVSKDPIVISTVLGSCISICMHSPEAKAGGMIHYALPYFSGSSTDEPLRYGDYAIPRLVKEMEKLTGRPAQSFIAKIIGGADGVGSNGPQKNVGEANVQVARSILKEIGIPIAGEDVGGSVGRKALFHVATARLQSAFVGPGFSRPSAMKAAGQPPAILARAEPRKKISVLIVDDSKTIRDLLYRAITQDPDFNVIGQAEDVEWAEQILKKTKPDVITLDVHMPKMTGVQWLEMLLPRMPIPVVMITSLQLQDGNDVFRALELGAVDYIQKPALNELSKFSSLIRERLRAAANAKVRRSVARRAIPVPQSPMSYDKKIVIAIGASTGGTEALREVLIRMPASIPPILVVQHIPPIFSRALAERLNNLCPFSVKEAENGDAIHENRVLIAPGGTQMKVVKKNTGLFVEVNSDPPVNLFQPSVDYLFHSVASHFGGKAVGAILTGMGADGAQGLLSMKNAGARTITQDEQSCVVYGMPKVAWEIGASEEAVSLEKLAEKFISLCVRRI